MKIMKLMVKKTSIVILAFLLGLASFSCSSDDDDDDVIIDKTELAASISEANTLISSTTEGTADGQYESGSQDILQDIIDLAQIVYDDEESTQTEVDNTVISLDAAIDTYYDSAIIPIDADNLVGQWTFDDGSGTVLTDYSGNDFDGTLEDGSDTWGGDLPTWTTDRYGDENKALNFDLGAHVTIPYNSALNPSEITITVWVKADEILESNRFIGLHSWNGYKFQLQSSNKPFFTANTDDATYDKDSDPTLDLDTWYHLAVTYGDGEMIFYVNGTEMDSYDELSGDLAAVTDHDLVFGQGSSQYASTTDDYDTDQIIPLAWGGYFHGSLDEIRIYKTVLTSSQISSIYEQEKVAEE
jgi:hypothetical protein